MYQSKAIYAKKDGGVMDIFLDMQSTRGVEVSIAPG